MGLFNILTRKKKCSHYGYGTATTYPIEKRYYNEDMRGAFGGSGWYREYALVVYCGLCGELLEVNGRRAKLKERIAWRLTGGKNRKHYESLPFLP